MTNISFRAMGTNVQIVIPPFKVESEVNINRAIELAKNKISQLEALLSRFRLDSEICSLNGKAGRWVVVHPSTFEILTLAKQAFLRTKGMFNPCLGSVLENAGYNVSFENITSSTTADRLVYEIPYIPPTRCPFELAPDEFKVFLESGYKIDLGGIAKGWIVKQAAAVLQQECFTQFLCNAGGDMICKGKNGEVPWCVAIADPFSLDLTLYNLDISDLSVATSGTYRRRWSHDGKIVHHIIDPFFGRPVDSDVLSCTVIHQDLVEAEVLAKVGLLLGVQMGQKWLNQQKTSGWIIVADTGEVIHA